MDDDFYNNIFGNNENKDDENSTPETPEDINTPEDTSDEAKAENKAETAESTPDNTTYHYGVNNPTNPYTQNSSYPYGNTQSSSQYPYGSTHSGAGTQNTNTANSPVGNAFNGYGQTPPNNSYPYSGAANANAAKKKKQKIKKPKKAPTWGKIIVLCLVCCIVTGLICSAGKNIIRTSGGTTVILQGERETKNIEINTIDSSKVLTAAEVYAANVNSTVGITTTITVNYFGYKTSQAAAGSGFIITADGYILTNYHVIEDSSSIKVTLYDDTKYEATIVGYDESNDVAVIKVDATDLTPVVLGDSDLLNVGDEVIAIGNPLGELTFSLTKGVVSALNRSVTTSDDVTMELIQTDCAINSGNSGGALFNMYGEVVGITNAKYSSDGDSSEASIDNIGFAIPMANVKEIVMSIIEKGYISKPYIGVSITTVSSESISLGVPEGAIVKEITEGGPADKAGLKVNDVITAINGQAVTSSDDVVDIVGDMAVGDKAELSIYRSGDTATITITIEEKVVSALAEEDDDTSSQSSNGYNYYGYGNDDSNGYGSYGGYDSFEDFFGQFFGNYGY